MIPRVIHQLWIGPNPAPTKFMDSWKTANPTFEYVYWDNERCASFKFENQAKIDAMPEWNGKADIIRYEILRKHGGIFIDADTIAMRPLEDEVLDHEVWTCFESEKFRPGLLACGYMGSVPNSKLMNMCVEEISKRNVAAARAWLTVGPMLLTYVASILSKPKDLNLHIYPASMWIPTHHTGLTQKGDVPPYAMQLWGSTLGYDRLGLTNAT